MGLGLAFGLDLGNSGGAAPTAPGAPTGLTVTVTGLTTQTLDWTAPASNGGSAITGYKIEQKIGAGAWGTLVADTGTTAVTRNVTGLTEATLYTYRISAINAIGTGNASSEASGTTWQTVVTTLNAGDSSPWVTPATLTGGSVTYFAVGGSGRGGNESGGESGGGSGGGESRSGTLAVATPGTTSFAFTISAGADTTIGGGTVIAVAGARGGDGNTDGGVGGAGGTGGTGGTGRNGGNGADFVSAFSGGGGGSSAGSAAVGVNAAGSTGATAPTDGGNGGNGGTNSNGSSGQVPGGGNGGGGGAGRTGGAATAGRIKFTYTTT